MCMSKFLFTYCFKQSLHEQSLLDSHDLNVVPLVLFELDFDVCAPFDLFPCYQWPFAKHVAVICLFKGSPVSGHSSADFSLPCNAGSSKSGHAKFLPTLCMTPTVVHCMALHVVVSDVAAEKQAQAHLQAVEGFNTSNLKHTDTKEKIVLPAKEGVSSLRICSTISTFIST